MKNIHIINIDDYEATTKRLNDEWGWKALKQLPEVEFENLLAGHYPNSSLLKQCIFNGCIVLKGSDGSYYSAYTADIPFHDDWRDDGYHSFGMFTKPNKVTSDIFPETS